MLKLRITHYEEINNDFDGVKERYSDIERFANLFNEIEKRNLVDDFMDLLDEDGGAFEVYDDGNYFVDELYDFIDTLCDVDGWEWTQKILDD